MNTNFDSLCKINPKVTIGIPVYNGACYIRQAIMSVLNQSFSNFELIVTDDGSTDNTVEILKKISDPRIRLVVDGKNYGISYRLNQQIDMSRGDYFFRMDADDIMTPNRVEMQYTFLKEHPNVDVVGSPAWVIDCNNQLIGKRVVKTNNVTIDDLFFHNRFIHPTVAGKIGWFRKWHYNDRFSGCEDMDLWIRSYLSSNFADLNTPILYYRDPLTFKLNTYLFRIKQTMSCCWQMRAKMTSRMTLIKCFALGVARIVVSILFVSIGKDSWLISRRNIPLSENDNVNKLELIR